MKKTIIYGMWMVFLLLTEKAFTQSSLYVGAGAQVYISPATTMTIDSLVLTPSSAYVISGQNLVGRNATTQHTASNPYINRVYLWQATLPPFTGTLTIYYRDAELNALPEGSLTLNVHNGNAWYAIPPATRDATNNYVSTDLNGMLLNELTLAAAGGPLPMRWIHAEANHVNNVNLVKWVTADEMSCKDYIVEKSTNGSNWQVTGAAIPAHNTTGPNNYQLTDPAASSPVTWYRIRQTDIDGRVSYSVILIVQLDKILIVQLYPNPVQSQFTISSGQALRSVQIYNAAGSQVYAKAINGDTYHTINSSGFASGSYYAVIQLQDGNLVKEYFIKR